MVVFEEGRVAIDFAAEAFAQDQLGVWEVEAGVEVGSAGALDAMIGPEGLGPVVDLDRFEGPLAGMG